MAWLASAPLSQTVIADGERFWYYDADLEQLTIQKADKSLRQSPAMILSGDPSLLDEVYTVSFATDVDNKGDQGFVLRPRQQGSLFVRLEMYFRANVLHRLVMLDGLQQQTHVTLDNIKLNHKIPDSEFSFVAPPGTDVIDDS